MKKISRVEKRVNRHQSIRKIIRGTKETPRLSVYRSNQHIYAQIIDDTIKKTLVSTSDLKLEKKDVRVNKAYLVGKELAEKAVKKGISKVVFDRGGFLYHGRIAKLADGAREGGLKF